MKFGDGLIIQSAGTAQVAVYLWRPDGCEPTIFLDGRVVHPELDAVLTPWRCPACRGVKLFWAVPRQVTPRCATCNPTTCAEQDLLLRYATGVVEQLASKLDDPTSKATMYQRLDEAVAAGDWNELARVSLEMLVGSLILKHHMEDLL